MNNVLIKEIDAILPQMQCGQCGFPGCEPYAVAIAEGRADINQCPPGDTQGIRELAALLGIEPKPLNKKHGLPKPKAVAVIDEAQCIGCTFCIRACPVDAIAGAAKQMHTVIADECTGCELCIVHCPMDCIDMVAVNVEHASPAPAESRKKVDRARMRYQFRMQRLAQSESEIKKQPASEFIFKKDKLKHSNDDRKHATVQAALKRAAALRAQVNRKAI